MRVVLSRWRWLATKLILVAMVAAMPSVARAAPPPIAGTHPWIVVLCKFTDFSFEPSIYTPSYFQQMFAGTGASTVDFTDWWSEISYNNLSVAGTQVTTRWYSLGMTRFDWAGLNRYDKITTCANSAVSDPTINNDFSKYYGVIAIFNDDSPQRAASTTLTSGPIGTGDATIKVASSYSFPSPPFAVTIVDGPQNPEEVHVIGVSGTTWTISRAYEGSPAQPHNNGATINLIDGGDLGAMGPGLVGITIGGKNYQLGLVVLPPQTNLGSAQHETGHGFGYNHSRALSTSTTDYQDCYDVMSWDVCHNYSTQVYRFQGDFGAAGVLNDPLPAAAGPGLDAITLDIQNWMPAGRTFTVSNSSCTQTTRDLAALNHPEASGDMEIRIPAALTIPTANGTTNSDYYTVELRDKSFWDRGIPQNAVLLHLHGFDGYSYWVDQFGGNVVGHSGALYLGDEFVDSANNIVMAVNRMNTPAHTASVAFAAGGAGGGCKIKTALAYSGHTSGAFNEQVTLAGDLVVNGTTVPIPNATVTFTLGSQGCSGTTDTSGHASCTITINQAPTGPSTVSATFAGDAAYNAASASSAFTISTINQKQSQLTYTGPTVILKGSGASLTLKAQLQEDGANDNDGDRGSPAPVPPGQTITLSIGSGAHLQSCTGTTNASGVAQCTIPQFKGDLGPQPLRASFAGDSYYSPSSDTSKTAIVFAFPSSGAFVLGDNTVAAAGPTTSVPWWGPSWRRPLLPPSAGSSLNSLSGPAAPPAFKGFAATVTTLPNTSPANVCGSTFTTRTGNSPPPPTGIPSYMGVLVASSVTQSDSTIKGHWAKIVVVKTYPGYAPNLGHPGTGTIITTFCR